jgi:HlyD family secretion protein
MPDKWDTDTAYSQYASLGAVIGGGPQAAVSDPANHHRCLSYRSRDRLREGSQPVTDNNKRALLSALTLDDTQRDAVSNGPRWLTVGVGGVLLAAIAWFYLVPDGTPLLVSVAIAQPAEGNGGNNRGAVLDASGYVTARRQATVSSKITGKVVEVFIEEGITVQEGQLLATLDSSTQQANFDLATAQMNAARARLAEVRVQIEEAELALTRTQDLTAKHLASTADLDRARLAVAGLQARLAALKEEVEVSRTSAHLQQQLLDDMQIRAPFTGVVVTKAAQPGEMISPVSGGGGFTRTGIGTIVDMDSLEIEVDVNESYINRVHAGQRVVATLNSYPDWEIPAEVITIIPTADRNKATVRVRIAFLQRDGRILPDMGVKVSFLEEEAAATAPTTAEPMKGVYVPGSAVRTVGDVSMVFVISDGLVNVRDVQLGARQGQQRQIVAGLASGERVVVGLNDTLTAQLTEGRRVTVAET